MKSSFFFWAYLQAWCKVGILGGVTAKVFKPAPCVRFELRHLNLQFPTYQHVGKAVWAGMSRAASPLQGLGFDVEQRTRMEE